MNLEQKIMNYNEMAGHLENLSGIIRDLEDTRAVAEKLLDYSLNLTNSNTYCGKARVEINKYAEYLNLHIVGLERLLLMAEEYLILCLETARQEDNELAKVFEETQQFNVTS